jgi:hypothetical protein
MYNNDDFVGGQPLYQAKKRNDVAKQWYQLGRTAAALDQQRMENTTMQNLNQMKEMSLTKQMMDMATQKNDIANMVSSVRDMKDQVKSMALPPPLPPEVGLPGGMPPMPPGVGLPGGMPPLPEGMGGGMPPPDMGYPQGDVPATLSQAPPLNLG